MLFGKYITYKTSGIKGESYTRVSKSNAGSGGVTKTVAINSNITANHAPTSDQHSSSTVVYPGGSKSSTVWTQADSRIKFCIPNQIPAGTQKVQIYFYASEKLDNLDIQILSNGKTIGQGGLAKSNTFDGANGIVTIPLIKSSDEYLNNAYINIIGEAQTHHEVSAGSTPSTATTKIGVTKMILYF